MRRLSRNMVCLLVLVLLAWSIRSVAVGIKQATGVGNVYNLKKLEDFEGKYVKAAAGIAVGGGAGATSLRNDKGVVINLTSVGQGVDFRLALSGMDVTLVK